jgi:hypothetical protein
MFLLKSCVQLDRIFWTLYWWSRQCEFGRISLFHLTGDKAFYAACMWTSGPKRLPSTRLRRRHAGQDQLDPCSLASFAIKMEPAAQTIRDDGVDDMETEASAASVPPGREERVEGLAPDIEAHAAAIV